jgi:hypothetical protein
MKAKIVRSGPQSELTPTKGMRVKLPSGRVAIVISARPDRVELEYVDPVADEHGNYDRVSLPQHMLRRVTDRPYRV